MWGESVRSHIQYYLNRLSEKLWVKPFFVCLLSIFAVFLAKAIEVTPYAEALPHINKDMLVSLLGIMASSMLVMATLAVGAMVAALASASNTATPRAFPLVVSDDRSQIALSVFVGAFIFSVIALVALKSDYFQAGGRFLLFLSTLGVFALVVMTFLRWVDVIARLGRVSNTIEKVEAATEAAICCWNKKPNFGARPADANPPKGQPIFCNSIGHIHEINFQALQDYASEINGRITLKVLPGAFASPAESVAYVECPDGESEDHCAVANAFMIAKNRVYENDPRFGFIVLSEIAGRALSPAVNDPGTAIDILGSIARLIKMFDQEPEQGQTVTYDRIFVPTLKMDEIFDVAFTSIAHHGAGTLEVAIRIQKCLAILAKINEGQLSAQAIKQSRSALARSKQALCLPEDFERVARSAPTQC